MHVDNKDTYDIFAQNWKHNPKNWTKAMHKNKQEKKKTKVKYRIIVFVSKVAWG